MNDTHRALDDEGRNERVTVTRARAVSFPSNENDICTDIRTQ